MGFLHVSVVMCFGSSPAYFGEGTRLTVLEPNSTVKPPTVTVLPPAQKQCKSRGQREKPKTLVCVASGFYPDHVSVTWRVDGSDVNTGVATDSDAEWKNGSYRITSSLTVHRMDWFTVGRNFTCTVSFFNGTHTVNVTRWAVGIENEGEAAERGEYLRITNFAKVSYSVLIVKSSIYGLFVVLVLCMLWASSGKQAD